MRFGHASHGRGRWSTWALGTALLFALAACSGDRFTSSGANRAGAPSGSSGDGGSGGASAFGGTGGDVGTGGDGAMAGSGNAAGSAVGGAGGSAGAGGGNVAGSGLGGDAGSGASCSCNSGEYCRAGSCLPCSDLSKLDFAAPEEILDDDTSQLRFPRVGPSEGSLFFTRVKDTGSELWYLPAIGASAPVSLGSPDTPSRSALDYFGDPGGLGFDVLFDEIGADARRSIRIASWQNDALTNVNDAPSPLSAGGFDTYSVAFASTPKRAYWMTTRDAMLSLRTGVIGSGESVVVDLPIPATDAAGVTCSRQADDATPWVTPDGKLLLFRAVPLDAQCEQVDGDASDLYIALLDQATGLPRANAVVALSGVNTTSDRSVQTDASFSEDLCTLYLASDGGAMQGHDFRLYRAARR